jgi:hypothetical protein
MVSRFWYSDELVLLNMSCSCSRRYVVVYGVVVVECLQFWRGSVVTYCRKATPVCIDHYFLIRFISSLIHFKLRLLQGGNLLFGLFSVTSGASSFDRPFYNTTINRMMYRNPAPYSSAKNSVIFFADNPSNVSSCDISTLRDGLFRFLLRLQHFFSG